MSTEQLAEAQKERARQKTRDWYRIPGNKERQAAGKLAKKTADPEAWKVQKRASSARYTKAHREELNAKQVETREQLRKQVIEAYGCKCNCTGCHVHHAELLTVDHIKGDGGVYRKEKGTCTRDLYRWIVNNEYPDTIQLLCGSCNLAKSSRDACPLAGVEH